MWERGLRLEPNWLVCSTCYSTTNPSTSTGLVAKFMNIHDNCFPWRKRMTNLMHSFDVLGLGDSVPSLAKNNFETYI